MFFFITAAQLMMNHVSYGPLVAKGYQCLIHTKLFLVNICIEPEEAHYILKQEILLKWNFSCNLRRSTNAFEKCF